MPEVIHASYNNKGNKFQPKVVDTEFEDVFVLENLLESGYENYDNAKSLDESHMMAVLECLAQLHGTGMAYKIFSISEDDIDENLLLQEKVQQKKDLNRKRLSKLKDEFPALEEQIQLGGRVGNVKKCSFKVFRAF